MSCFKLILLSALLLFIQPVFSQSCGTCSVNITTKDSSAYVVTAGHTFCIDSTGKFTGSITLNGGSICNKGVFKPKSFNLISGNFYNRGGMLLSSSLTLGSGITMQCAKRSFMRLSGDLTVSGGSYTNQGIANVTGTTGFTSGTFSNSGILNCHQMSGTTTNISNTGIINHD